MTLAKRLLLGGTATIAMSIAAQGAFAQDLRFWTTEEQPDRLAKQEELAAAFEAETGISVQVIPISESDLGTRATAAFAAGDLPDVIYHTLQYVLPWSEAGILDTEAATEVVEDLGIDTFAPGALAMADFEGDIAAVPVDGWTQMVVYRRDLFEEAGLEPPTSYANITAALEALHNPPEMYGFVAATKIDENFMSQVLEHVFLANGVTPVREDGSTDLDEAATIEVLEFYKAIADASPPGELFWQQSRELYFAGQTAMIIWSPFIMDELAGLRDSNPPTINDDPQSLELAGRTGFVTTLAGPSNPDGAAWADIRYLGITADADTDAAMEFVTGHLQKEFEGIYLVSIHATDAALIHTVKKPIKTLEDFKGMKLRVAGRFIGEAVKALGATPVGIPLPGVYEALSRGQVEGMLINWAITKPFRFYEVTNHHSELALYQSMLMTMMRGASYNKLPADLKAVVDRNSGIAWAKKMGVAWDTQTAPARKAIVDHGNNVFKVSDAEIARWKKTVQPAYDAWIAEMNGRSYDGAALFKTLQDITGKHGRM